MIDSGFRGCVITSHDKDYDEVRTVFYGDLNRKPKYIIRVQGPDDIATAIKIAQENNLELAIRSGGHSIAGYSTTDGGIVIDLRDLKKIERNKKEI